MTLILAIETSCDETAAAVVEDGRRVLSNVVATQIELHRRFGGVFPEVASRQHVLAIEPVIRQALAEAGVAQAAELDAIAVTHGPGLAGSLLVGVNAAKGMAFAAGRPLLAVNHLEGHVYSNWLDCPARGDRTHRQLPGPGADRLRRPHRADPHDRSRPVSAAGRHAGRRGRRGVRQGGAPAGAGLSRRAGHPAAGGGRADARRFALPRALRHDRDHRFDFSFSGLKTAVLHLTQRLAAEGQDLRSPALLADLAASFQQAVADVLVEKTADAAVAYAARQVCICGGVSANACLRVTAQRRFAELGLPLYIPPLALCTDNAAMIGAAAFYRWRPMPELMAAWPSTCTPICRWPETRSTLKKPGWTASRMCSTSPLRT